MQNPGIIRNRAKILSTIKNAQCILDLLSEGISFDEWIWKFVDGEPIDPNRPSAAEIPSKTEVSILMSKELLKRGFKFVGPTICYAFMQAAGLVNDHTVDCFRHKANRSA
jgi:DNA-3-methyladenine glycosylase I